MISGWKRLGVQSRFMILAALGVAVILTTTLSLIAWFEYAALESRLRGLSENELGSLDALVETAMRAPLVLLDDIGSERDFPTNPIPDVIFERHAQDLPTWATTGLTRDPLVVRYGAGVVARLFERARVIHVGAKGWS